MLRERFKSARNLFRPHHLVVRIPLFHSGDASSILAGDTFFNLTCKGRNDRDTTNYNKRPCLHLLFDRVGFLLRSFLEAQKRARDV